VAPIPSPGRLAFLDPRRIDLNVQPELYNLDAAGYESVLLGLFAIWPGQFEDSDRPHMAGAR
jgi:hypothetical protein